MKHIWSVLCQKSVVDVSSNNVSLIDVFERLEVDVVTIKTKDQRKITEFVLPMQYELVSLWVKTRKSNQEEQSDVKIVLESPGGAEINKFEKILTIPKEKQRIRDINKIQGIRLSKSGVYVFKVRVRPGGSAAFETVAEIPLEIYFNAECQLAGVSGGVQAERGVDKECGGGAGEGEGRMKHEYK